MVPKDNVLCLLLRIAYLVLFYFCFWGYPVVYCCGDVKQSLRKFTCPRSYTAVPTVPYYSTSMWRVASSPHCMNVEILIRADDSMHSNTHNRSCRALENLGHCPVRIVSCTPHTVVRAQMGAFRFRLCCATTFTSVSQFSPFPWGTTTIPRKGKHAMVASAIKHFPETSQIHIAQRPRKPM